MNSEISKIIIFPKTDDKYEYSVQRTEEEVAALLLNDLEENDNVVLASVRGNYSEQIEKLFDLAVYIDIPKEIRMARVRKRSNDNLEIVCYQGETFTRAKNVSLKWLRRDLMIMQKGG